MSENRKNLGSNKDNQRGGRMNEDLENSRQNAGNQQKKGTSRLEDQEGDESLERDSSSGARKNVRTGKGNDLQEGSSSGRSGSIGKDEQDRRNHPNQGKR